MTTSAELTYVALRPLRVGGQVRPKGSLVPEARTWHNIDAYVSSGRIAPVLASLHEKDSPGEDPLEEFHTGNGWYLVPGSDRKMRRSDAQKALERQE